MGRYFPYTLHPLFVAECAGGEGGKKLTHPPRRIDEDQWQALWRNEGFPEPFLKADNRFYTRWRNWLPAIFLVEVKTSGGARLSEALALFQSQTGAEHAYQLGFDLDYVEQDCFEYKKPLIVPARTFLAQLV